MTMFKTKATRVLVLILLGLVLALSAVGTYAAVRDDNPESASTQDSQQGTDDSDDTGDSDDDEPARAWIGIAAAPNEDGDGVVIRHVIPDSPADQAGLEQGDVITSADGDTVSDMEDLHDAISDKSPGDTVSLTVIREDGDGGSEDVSVTLGEAPLDKAIKDFGLGGMGPLADIFDGGFDEFLGGEFRYTDDDGNPVTIEVVPGTVAGVSDDSITIDVNGDEGERTFDLGDDVTAPDGIESGDDAVVVLKDGEVAAVLPGLGKLIPGLPGLPGLPGPPGFGPGRGFHFNGPNSGVFENLPLPDSFRDWFPDIQPQEESAGPDA
jgi:membrane-associated protease RseP (regulator of RpoE activity)